jgi:hypothetical protein
MKIVHASNFSLKRKGRFFYGIPYKLSNGLTRSGHSVFNFCDRDVADSYFVGVRAVGVSYANRKLIDVCEQIRPDLLLLGHCTIISESTLLKIRQVVPAIKIAHWNCDALFNPRNFERIRSLMPLVDATFVTTAGRYLASLANAGGRITFMPNPVDCSIETLRVFERDDVDNDLVFVTGPCERTSEKAQLCESVRRRIPNLKFDVYGLSGRACVFGAKFFDVIGNAKMAINVSARNDVHLYSSDRMSQLVGCGLLTFVDRRTGFDAIFNDDELVFYEDSNDLVGKLRFFHANDSERRRIAHRGWRKAHDALNATLVSQWIIEATFREPASAHYSWPTRIYGEGYPGSGVGSDRERVAKHRPAAMRDRVGLHHRVSPFTRVRKQG